MFAFELTNKDIFTDAKPVVIENAAMLGTLLSVSAVAMSDSKLQRYLLFLPVLAYVLIVMPSSPYADDDGDTMDIGVAIRTGQHAVFACIVSMIACALLMGVANRTDVEEHDALKT